MLQYQFPNLDLESVLGNNLFIEVSRKTKRIKTISDDSQDPKVLLFSLRTSDGRFLPTFEGGIRILASGYRENLVMVSDDASKYVAQGKSTFCKHVLQVSSNIYPKSEVFVINNRNELLAVGTAIQPGYAMLELSSGVAVRPKHISKTKVV